MKKLKGLPGKWVGELTTLQADENADQHRILVLALQLSEYTLNINLDESLHYAQVALDASHNISDPDVRSVSINNALIRMAEVNTHLGHYDLAVDELTRIVKAYEAQRDRLTAARALMMIGNINFIRNKNQQALEYLNRALRIANSVGDDDLIHQISFIIGRVHYNKGDFDKALEIYHQALTFYREKEDKKNLANVFNALGTIYSRIQGPETSLEYFETALNYYQELGMSIRVAAVLNNIGTIHLDRKQYEQALLFFKQSLKIKRQIGNPVGLAVVWENIGDVHRHKGDYARAALAYEKGLRIYEELGDQTGIAGINLCLARNYICQGQHTHALEALERSYNIGVEYEMKDFVRECCEEFAHYYEGVGQFREALEWHKLLLKAREEIFNAELGKQVSELNSRFEIEKKEKESEIYRLRNIELTLANHRLKEANKIVKAKNKLIMEQKEALNDTLRKLRESEAQFRGIFDTAVVGIVASSPTCEILLANNHFADMLGYRPEELTGKSLMELSHPLDAPIESAYNRKLNRHEIEQFRMQKRFLRKDGSAFWTLQSCSAIHSAENRILSQITIVVDIDDRMRAVQNLNRSYQDLKKAQSDIIELERRNMALAMAVTANHELNQPLMVIHANLEMLSWQTQQDNNPTITKYLDRIEHAFAQIQEILKRFRNSESVTLQDYLDETKMLVFTNDHSDSDLKR